MKKTVVLFVAWAITLNISHGQIPNKHGWDTSVCTQMSTSQNDLDHKRPLLPKQFGVRVEANIMDQNYTVDVREWYDEPNNRGALEEYDDGIKMFGIYDYDLNELVVVVPLQNSDFHCAVTDLAKDPNRFIFGTKTYSNGTDRMYTAAGALRFGGSQPEKYLGVTTVRGIQCDTWQSCAYWQDMDATMTIKWFFSRPDWLTAKEISQVPVRCHVTGKIWNNTAVRNFEHIYEFSELQETLDGETKRFETPQGAYCPGMKTRTKHPVPPNEFSFGAEVQILEQDKITYMKESYDHDSKLVKLEYKPSSFGGAQGTTDRTTEIHDFNTGLAYVVDEIHNNCSVKLLTVGFDSEASGGLNVRMRSSSEFFFSNQTSFIAYEGIRTIRGIECDVWIANKNDWPVGNSLNSTWEWYFARQEWQSNAGYSFESQMPVGIFITIHTDPAQHYYYNIYDYDETSGNIWNYDISSCYSTANKKFFQFLLQGNFTKDVLSDELAFKSFVTTSTVAFLGVSPLRISELDVDHNDKYIKVTFYLLDAAPFTGDITNFPVQVPLAGAAQKLTNAIKQGSFAIPIAAGSMQNIVNLTAVPYSDKLWGFHMMTVASLTGPPDDEPEEAFDEPEPEVDLERMLDEVLEPEETNVDLKVQNPEPKKEVLNKENVDDELKQRLYKRSVISDGLEFSALQLCQQPPTGYSGGALAGIAIGMLALGFLACFGAILLGSKYGSRAIRSQGYEMT